MSSTRYHRLPEDNRPSTDSNAGVNEALLGPLVNDGATSTQKSFQISLHPTVWTRAIVVLLLFPAMIILFSIGRGHVVPYIIFIIICLLRNVSVLLLHFISHCVRIRIEFPRNSPDTPSSKNPFKWLAGRKVQIWLDLILWVLFLIAVTVTGTVGNRCNMQYHYRGSYCSLELIMSGYILGWAALPFYLVSAIDAGKPSSIKTAIKIVVERVKEPVDDEPSEPPQVYRDLEGGGSEPRATKSGADSPVVV